MTQPGKKIFLDMGAGKEPEGEPERVIVTDRRGVEVEGLDEIPEFYVDHQRSKGLTDEEIVIEYRGKRAEVKRQMSPPGAFPHLTPALEEKRLKYEMIDALFQVQAAYDYIYIWQLPYEFVTEQEKGEVTIHLPDESKERMSREAPRGIIVSAGLGALDELRAHGMDVGHTVRFLRFSNWRMPVGWLHHQPVYVIPMPAGAVRDSEETGIEISQGRLRVAYDEAEKEHVYEWLVGGTWVRKFKPRQVLDSPDYES